MLLGVVFLGMAIAFMIMAMAIQMHLTGLGPFLAFTGVGTDEKSENGEEAERAFHRWKGVSQQSQGLQAVLCVQKQAPARLALGLVRKERCGVRRLLCVLGLLLGLFEGFHDVSLRFLTQSLDGFLLGEVTRSGNERDFLCAWLVASSDVDLRDPSKFFERRPDVLLATRSRHASHGDRVGLSSCSISTGFAEGVHFVSAGLLAERFDGFLFGQIARSGKHGHLLSAGFVTRSDANFGDTCKLLERRTDVLLTACSSDSGHAHRVGDGFLLFRNCGKAQRKAQRSYE